MGLVARAAAAVVVLALASMLAPASAVAQGDQQCLACHATPGLEKTLADGDTLSLHIDGDHFAPSVHAALGCTGCHADINPTSHPPAENPIASKRAFATNTVPLCATCHAAESGQWGQSVHAALVRDGNPNAPICTGCHSPHTMLKGEAASIETVPCKTCHAAIFTAYDTSMHGVARRHGLTASPLCADCHGAHDVSVPSAGVGRKEVCLGCHTEALDTHRAWLPNVDLHFGVVSCPVCHTPRARRMVNLILYNSATDQQISRPAGIPEFENLSSAATATTSGLAPAALMTLLRALNHQGADGQTIIRGRLEVRTGVEDHQLALASQAIGDCATCHRKGAAAFESVSVSVAGPAGIPIRYDADKAVLNSVFSIDSVSGFYAIGGTRVTLLDGLLLLALLGGIAWPLAHLTVRWLAGRYLDLTTPHHLH